MITRAIDTFSSGTFAVARKAAGSRVDGLFVDGATTALNFDMAIQPIEGRDLKAVPSGFRAEDVRLVLTKSDLRVNDVVTYKSESWTVYRAQDWTLRGASWTRAYMARNLPVPIP